MAHFSWTTEVFSVAIVCPQRSPNFQGLSQMVPLHIWLQLVSIGTDMFVCRRWDCAKVSTRVPKGQAAHSGRVLGQWLWECMEGPAESSGSGCESAWRAGTPPQRCVSTNKQLHSCLPTLLNCPSFSYQISSFPCPFKSHSSHTLHDHLWSNEWIRIC